MQALFKSGNPQFMDYTPTAGAVSAGDVVVLRAAASNTINGLTCGIAHHDMANNEPGSLAIGGGVYEVTNLNNAADYVQIYWDNSANKVTTTATNNALFGSIVGSGGGGANTACLAKHEPFVSPPIV